MKLFHDNESHQINILDERFYQSDNGEYYPSVTTVLSVYPKGYGFIKWLKDVGSNATQVMEEAGAVGTKIHAAIEDFLKGNELKWMDEEGNGNYTLIEWQMLMKFHDFWQTYKPTILGVEIELVSDSMRIGGTIDLPCIINGERWLIDHKTSNSIYTTHELQLSAYSMMWNEANPDQKIDRTGVMWLKAATRGADKSGKKIQGAGWQLKEFPRHYTEGFKLYQHCRALWNEENPNYKPKNLIYPDSLKK